MLARDFCPEPTLKNGGGAGFPGSEAGFAGSEARGDEGSAERGNWFFRTPPEK